MMDGTPESWVGYHRWHAFARASMLLGADAELWTHIDHCIALAWAIQSEARPTVDRPDNPELPLDRLALLRNSWISLPVERLDWAFSKHRGAAPAPNLMEFDDSTTSRYGQVQQLLRNAAVTGSPQHLGHDGTPLQRFWELPYADFIAIQSVWGVQLIADPGPQRGARSGLVQMLKGTEPTMPGMVMPPPPNQPLDPASIQVIETWIDEGCPE